MLSPPPKWNGEIFFTLRSKFPQVFFYCVTAELSNDGLMWFVWCVPWPLSCCPSSALFAQMQRLSFLRAEPPCVLAWLSNCLRGVDMEPFPYLPNICWRTRLLVLVRQKIDYKIFSLFHLSNRHSQEDTGDKTGSIKKSCAMYKHALCSLDCLPAPTLSVQLSRVQSSVSVETFR